MHAFAFWLMPQEPLRSELRELIRRLAAAYHSVEFEPHVTVFFGPSSAEQITRVADQVASEYSIVLFPSKISYASDYTKALFVQIERCVILQRLHDTVSKSLGRSPIRLDPHISLLYARLPRHEQRYLYRDYRHTPTFPGPYLFDSLRVIRSDLTIDGPEAVSRWETVHEVKLGTGTSETGLSQQRPDEIGDATKRDPAASEVEYKHPAHVFCSRLCK